MNLAEWTLVLIIIDLAATLAGLVLRTRTNVRRVNQRQVPKAARR